MQIEYLQGENALRNSGHPLNEGEAFVFVDGAKVRLINNKQIDMTDKQLNEDRLKIAAFIQKRRNELGISQAALAELTGMGIATIKRFESGKFWLNMKQYILLRNALQLPTSF